MTQTEIIAAKLAEWNLTLTDEQLAQLVPAHENLLRWQKVVEDFVHNRQIADGMTIPESEPLLVHAIEKEGSSS